MRMLLALAWRNVWRNRRRSIITMLAIVFATLLTVAMRGMQLGSYETSITYSTQMLSGSMQMQPTGWQSAPTLQKSLRWSDAFADTLAAVPGISGAAPRIRADGLVCFREKSLGAAIHGIDPVRERTVTSLHTRVRTGSFPAPGSAIDAAAGITLLENLGANVGDTLVLLAQGFDGVLGNIHLRVAGALRTGAPDIDGGALFMPLATLQDMLGMEGRVNYVALSVARVGDIAEARDALAARVDTTGRGVRTWDDIMPEFTQMIELDNVSGIFYLCMLIVVVAFGVLNTVLMSVTERFREFGMLLAMGMPHHLLARTVLVEVLVITGLGLVAGNLAAWGVTSYMAAHPIVFGGEFAKFYEMYGFAPQLNTIVDAGSFVFATLSVLGISLVAVIWPIARVWRLSPLGGIRYT